MRVPARNFGVRRLSWRTGVLAVAGVVAATGGMLAPATGGTPASASAPEAAATAAADTFGFQVQLGPEQRLSGPNGEIDVPFFSERDARNRLFGVMGTSRTKIWKTANNTRLARPRLILDRGRAGAFDECGVWLMSIQKLTRRNWIGFYHSENKGRGEATCDHISDTTVWRMGIAETTNGGRSWFRPNYANNNNVVLTGKGATRTRGTTHAGNGRVVRLGDYYYMLFQTSHGAHPELPGVHIARATVASEGRPGSWKKWFCHPATTLPPRDAYCAFDEPGIGGSSTPINGLGEKARYVTWNSYLRRWIGLDAAGRRGFRLFASAEGAMDRTTLMDWTGSTDIYPPVSTATDKRVDQWGGSTRTKRSRQLYAYPSILGTKGHSSRTGRTFYIYYMKLFPGDKFDRRYLFRRKVTLVKSSAPYHRVELTTYKSRKNGDRRTTTEAPKSKAFRRTGGTGYLLSQGLEGWKQAFECTRRGDFAIYTNKCRRGWTPYRRIGWIHPTKTGIASVPVFRCFDKQKRAHFASTRRGCGGKKREARLGFALTSL